MMLLKEIKNTIKMKNLLILYLFFLFITCSKFNNILLKDRINFGSIKKVELYNENLNLKVLDMTNDNFLKELGDLKKNNGIWKYYGKSILLLKTSNGNIDTLYTNGYVFQYKGEFFKSEMDIIDKYFNIKLYSK
jgi:hypothetical protein